MPRLGVELGDDGLLELRFGIGRPVPAAPLGRLALDPGEDAGRLFPAHDRNARIGPGPQEPRRIGPAAHAVVARAERTADQHRDLGNLGGCDRRDELGAVLGDPGVLVFPAHHEAGDVLEEDERNPAPGAEFDEMGAFERAFGIQDSVARDDADGDAMNMGKPGHERRPVAGLEFVEPGAINDPRDHLPHIIGRSCAGRHDAEQLLGVIERQLGRGERNAGPV